MIKVGIGGWTFEPWRGVFYPKGLPHAQELGFASRKVTAIEVNGTFYRTQRPQDFRKWASESPDDFVFSLKAPRYAVNRSVLAEAGPSIERFVESGISELKHKLGPILWQFAPTKKFDQKDFGAFLALLPKKAEGLPLRHVVEIRHPSFLVPEFIALVREAEAAVVLADHDEYPAPRRCHRRLHLCTSPAHASGMNRRAILRRRSPNGQSAPRRGRTGTNPTI